MLDLAEDSLRAQGDLRDDGTLLADLDGARIAASVVAHGDERIVFTHGHNHRLELVDPLAATARHDASGGRLTAPMPGRIISIEVAEGDSVRAGQQLMVLEAMKMEHTITAPASGTVAAIRFALGDQVPEGAELIAFEAAD
jgi:3-methylcrotonyl-CoA carboxylase alpha subunit